MVVPTQRHSKKTPKPTIKSKVRYYSGLVILLCALGMFVLGRSYLLMTGAFWFVGLVMVMSSIKWPQIEIPQDDSNIIRANQDHKKK